MNIIAKSSNIATPIDLYKLTQAPDRQKLTNAKGSTLELDSWVLYEEQDAKGNTIKLLSLATKDGTAYCTNSATFCRDFESAIAMFKEFGEEFHIIEVLTGTSKNGRDFISCKVLG